MKLYSELSKLRVPEAVRGVPDELAAAQRIAPVVLQSTHDGALPHPDATSPPPHRQSCGRLLWREARAPYCRETTLSIG